MALRGKAEVVQIKDGQFLNKMISMSKGWNLGEKKGWCHGSWVGCSWPPPTRPPPRKNWQVYIYIWNAEWNCSPLHKWNAFAYAQAIWDFGVGVHGTKINSPDSQPWAAVRLEQSFSFTLKDLNLFKTIRNRVGFSHYKTNASLL